MRLPSVVVMVAVAWDSEAAVAWHSEVVVARDFEVAVGLTTGTGVDSPMAVTMAAPITVAADTIMGTMLVTDGMEATTVGTADMGGIHTTVGVGVLAGRTGDGDMDTTVTILGITPPILIILTRTIVPPVILALSTETTTRHQQTPIGSPGIPPQNLLDLTRALLTLMKGVVTTLGSIPRFSQLSGK